MLEARSAAKKVCYPNFASLTLSSTLRPLDLDQNTIHKDKFDWAIGEFPAD